MLKRHCWSAADWRSGRRCGRGRALAAPCRRVAPQDRVALNFLVQALAQQDKTAESNEYAAQLKRIEGELANLEALYKKMSQSPTDVRLRHQAAVICLRNGQDAERCAGRWERCNLIRSMRRPMRRSRSIWRKTASRHWRHDIGGSLRPSRSDSLRNPTGLPRGSLGSLLQKKGKKKTSFLSPSCSNERERPRGKPVASQSHGLAPWFVRVVATEEGKEKNFFSLPPVATNVKDHVASNQAARQ